MDWTIPISTITKHTVAKIPGYQFELCYALLFCNFICKFYSGIGILDIGRLT